MTVKNIVLLINKQHAPDRLYVVLVELVLNLVCIAYCYREYQGIRGFLLRPFLAYSILRDNIQMFDLMEATNNGLTKPAFSYGIFLGASASVIMTQNFMFCFPYDRLNTLVWIVLVASNCLGINAGVKNITGVQENYPGLMMQYGLVIVVSTLYYTVATHKEAKQAKSCEEREIMT